MKPGSILALLLCLLAFGCKKFEYSPYQEKETSGNLHDLNALNLARLKAAEPSSDDTVTIIYSGDSQRFYNELEQLVKKVNSIPNVDFYILCGDIADFGVLKEYEWVSDRLAKLNVPYLCAIGNHDLAANGGEIFTRIFGEKNFSFTYKGYKFLFHDTNGREYGFNGKVPDIAWLASELNDPLPDYFVGVSHVSPYNEDFDKKLETAYKNLFAERPNFLVSLHGHLHGATDGFPYDDHVRYMTSNAIEKPEFLVLKFIHGTIIKQLISYR